MSGSDLRTRRLQHQRVYKPTSGLWKFWVLVHCLSRKILIDVITGCWQVPTSMLFVNTLDLQSQRLILRCQGLCKHTCVHVCMEQPHNSLIESLTPRWPGSLKPQLGSIKSSCASALFRFWEALTTSPLDSQPWTLACAGFILGFNYDQTTITPMRSYKFAVSNVERKNWIIYIWSIL